MRIKIDWLDLWTRFMVESPFAGMLPEKAQSIIEKLVDEQIEAQEEMYEQQYPGDEPPPHDPLAIAAEKAVHSGSIKDLREYMKLRRERIENDDKRSSTQSIRPSSQNRN